MAAVFVSYSRSDADLAQKIVAGLEDHGVSTWFDRSLEAGSSFPEQITQQLRACGAVLCCWTVNSVRSQWVQAEALQAFQQAKLLPVLLDDCSVPVPFNSVHSVDLRNSGASLDSRALAPILVQLATLLRRPALRAFSDLCFAPAAERFVAFRELHSNDRLFDKVKHLCIETLGRDIDSLEEQASTSDLPVPLPEANTTDNVFAGKRDVIERRRAEVVENCASLVGAALKAEFRYHELEVWLRGSFVGWSIDEGKAGVRQRQSYKDWQGQDVVEFKECHEIVQDDRKVLRERLSDRNASSSWRELALTFDTIDDEHALEDLATVGRIYWCERGPTEARMFVSLNDNEIDIWLEVERQIDEAFDFPSFKDYLSGLPNNETLAVQFEAARFWLNERFFEHCASLDLDPKQVLLDRAPITVSDPPLKRWDVWSWMGALVVAGLLVAAVFASL